jgi:hypothetical protein
MISRIESNSLRFREVKNHYTPIVKDKINEFIEIVYYTKSIYSVTWINRFEEFKTNYVLGRDLHDFILMIDNKYYNILTNKIKGYEN